MGVRWWVTGVVGLGLVAASCGSSGTTEATTVAPTSASPGSTAPPATTAAGATTAAPASTAAAPSTAAVTTVPPASTAPASTVATPVPGGTITVGVEAEVGSPWVPQTMNCDAACILRARTFFEGLVNFDRDGNVVPYLAQSVTANANSTEFTIKLRPGITFHDGTPLDAAAVAENFRRYTVSGLTARGLLDVARKPDGSPDLTIVDPLTLTIRTSKPWYDFPRYLTGFVASPAWLKAVDADPTKATQPVGTGPFKFDSWTAGDRLVVKKNPTYWRKDEAGRALPYLDGITFKVIPDEGTRANALESGAVDMIVTDSGENLAKFRGDSRFAMTEQSDHEETLYLLMNVGQAGSPLQDKRVRCGLAAATDPKGLIQATASGTLQAANGLFSPGQDGYLEDSGAQGYDPAKAKELIAAYTAEKGAPPKITYSTTTDTTGGQVASLLQQSWGDAGVDVSIQQVEQSKLILDALLGDPSFNVFGWRNHGGFSVDTQYVWWHSKNSAPPGQLALNFGRLQDPVIDQLLDQNRSEPDPAKRKALAQQINKRFAEECWVIPISWAIWADIRNPNIQGLDPARSPDGTTLWDGNGTLWFDRAWRT